MADSDRLARVVGPTPGTWWRWLSLALIVAMCLGPGGLERLHVGVSHNHASRQAPHRSPAGAAAEALGEGSEREISAPCDVCRELEWARVGQTGTGSPVLVYSPTDFIVERVIPIAEQVRSIQSTASIRSRAPPIT